MEVVIETERNIEDGRKEERRYEIVPKKRRLFERGKKDTLTVSLIEEGVLGKDGFWLPGEKVENSLGQAPQEIRRVTVKDKEVEFWLLDGTWFVLNDLSQIKVVILPEGSLVKR